MLTLHILTASATLIICLLAWLKPSYLIQKALMALTGVSLGSGVLLALDPSHFTRTFCIRLGVYLTIIALTHWRLQKALKTTNLLQSPLHE